MEPRRLQKQGQAEIANAVGGDDASFTGDRALVVGAYPVIALKEAVKGEGGALSGWEIQRPDDACLAEAESLAHAIGLTVVKAILAPLRAIRPATYLGKGRVADLAVLVRTEKVGLVIVDARLTPVQQRNLEEALKTKVLDRTGLILEIFGERARTKEGVLQVEHAHLSYQKSRLVRSWTHLERQRGGFGFLGGPGETQIEADRRAIQERLDRIEKDLENVRRTRRLHREARSKRRLPVIALVGYTNAGKSTLFNRLTGSDVMAEDLLFATLDPTMRGAALPGGQEAVFTDTVGFVSDRPTDLVAAFRATLEEVRYADLVMHVRDIAHPDTEAQKADVLNVLTALGVDAEADERIIEVWNKADLLDDDERERLKNMTSRRDAASAPVLVSATTGEGIETLLEATEKRVRPALRNVEMTIAPEEGAAVNWLYEKARVLDRTDREDGWIVIHAEMADAALKRFERQFPEAAARTTSGVGLLAS